MKLLDRYLLREMVVPFLIGQAAIVMMLTGTVLYNNAEILIQNSIPAGQVARMVLYFLPFLLHMTMPVGMAVAASLSVSRLAKDSEITVLRAAGASLRRIFAPIVAVGLIASVVDFYFGEYAVPAALSRFNAVMVEMATHSPRLIPQAGRWVTAPDQSVALYVKTMIPLEKGRFELHGIQIVVSPQGFLSGDLAPIIVTAKDGYYDNGSWVLEKPFTFRYHLETGEWQVSNEGRYTLNTYVDPQTFQSSFNLQLPMYKFGDAAANTFAKIAEDLERYRQAKIIDRSALLNYHFKLSVPFSCLVMAICCPPLALRFARGGGFVGTLLSICLVFVYWNTLLAARIVGMLGPDTIAWWLSPVAAWSQNVVFALLGLYVLRKSE